uniref:Uncharacterized protein n=1 Tax=Heterorhabditis bacteriophora TaxID=37862 RepID=A0A1I7WWQ0_HETBA
MPIHCKKTGKHNNPNGNRPNFVMRLRKVEKTCVWSTLAITL